MVIDSGPDNASPDADREDASAHVADSEELTIQQTSQLLDVPAPTIRSWERRYGVPAVERSSGGHRRYTHVQLDQLRRMRDLIEEGRRPVEAAALVKAAHATSPGTLVEAFLQAARELAPAGIDRTLNAARETLGLGRTIDEVLMPAMRELGDWWYTGRVDASLEHLATNATQAWLAALRPTAPLRRHPPIVLGCGPLDHHSLGLEAIGALLRDQGWDCRMLGARTPAEALANAAAETGAAAVVLVCHVPAGRRAAVEALRFPELRHRHLFYAGGAFTTARARHGVPGRYLGTHIARASDLITDTLTSAPL